MTRLTMQALRLATRQLRSHWRSGEIRVLLLALVLAVGAMSAVGFFTDRIQSALSRQGASLIGADMVVVGDHPLPQGLEDQAHAQGLAFTRSIEFPSMVMHGEQGQLAEIKAVGEGYPLRGQLQIAERPYGQPRAVRKGPSSGELWIEPRLASQLNIEVGDSLEVGAKSLRVTAILQQDPARAGGFFGFAPRLIMHLDDIASTGLIQVGSRVSYRLLVAGNTANINRYFGWAESRLGRGERLESAENARPEIRSALEKTRPFLGLAAMAGAVLAFVAVALAAAQFARRQMDACALMRCFGSSQAFILQVFFYQILMIGVLGSLAGCLLGYLAQEVLAQFAGRLFLETLPAPGWEPLGAGMVAGVAALLGIVFPQLMALRQVPALRILRQDVGLEHAQGMLRNLLLWLPGAFVFLVIVHWTARDLRLGGAILAGLMGLLCVIIIMSYLLGFLLRRVMQHSSGAWRLGLANLLRRPVVSTLQVAGFGLGITAMLLLTIVRGDLLQAWRDALPADAPNRYVINIQPDQRLGIQTFFTHAGLATPTVYPMVRGRLVSVNGQAIDTSRYQDDRARRLAEREFNLSWSALMQPDNQLVAGRWWLPAESGSPQLSLEKGIAETLGIALGDRLGYEIGGKHLEVTVTSLRKVDWDTLKPNFFAITPPGVLEAMPVSYMTACFIPADRGEILNRLVHDFPNVTVIDVAAVLEQVRSIIDRMAYAVQFVFGFCLLAGVAVLYAALVATRDERVREVALIRVFGATRRQVGMAVVAEFVWIGALAGFMSASAASLIAYFVSDRLLHLPYVLDPMLFLLSLLVGAACIPGAAWLGIRKVILTPPRSTLQST